MDEVLEDILDEISPELDEMKGLKATCQALRDTAEKYREDYEYEPLFCGSIAKDTWLKSKKDIDLFLLFEEEVEMDELEERGLEAGKKIVESLEGEWDIAYAEHPYVEGHVRGYKVDIVPAYDTEPDDIKSSVDRTPWHVRWVEENLSKEQRDEVRLLKKFTKEHGLYGSDLRTRGFSGYLCEILIAECGSFKELVKKAAEWTPGKVIDPENYFKSKGYLKREKFGGDALIVVDPVDKNRNVASVLSAENFLLFKKKIRQFLENPTRDRFFGEKPEPLSMDELQDRIDRRGTDFMLIRFGAPEVHEDVLYPQMRKMNRRVEEVLEDEGFVVLRKDVWSDMEKCVLILELEVDELPRVDKREGPPIFDRRNSEKFIHRYEGEHNLLVEDGKWYAEYFREWTTALDFVRDFLYEDEETLQEEGVPRHLAEKISDGLTIATSDHSLHIFQEEEGLRKKMAEYFEKDLA
ncbi:MAG: CCA tRNA nucleotidyltransferase [Candidatus Aenigmatarchaeota archaeon]